MTKKTQAAYLHLLRTIDKTWKFNPVSVTTDFEKALRNALRSVYPNTQLIGCWFHYAQALRRKVKKIAGFAKFLKETPGAKKLYQKFVNLPLIRSDKISLAVALFKKEASVYGSRFTTFINYFEDEWMKKVGPDLFCVFLEKHRTNNLMESFNSIIKRKVPHSGCFFRFIEFLQSEELLKSTDYNIVFHGGVQVYPEQRKKFREKNETIFKYQTKFQNGEIGTTDFFNKMEELYDDSDDDDEEEVDSDDDLNEMLCVVCNLNEKSVVLEPCNHLKICENCITAATTCPFCNENVTGHKIVFL